MGVWCDGFLFSQHFNIRYATVQYLEESIAWGYFDSVHIKTLVDALTKVYVERTEVSLRSILIERQEAANA